VSRLVLSQIIAVAGFGLLGTSVGAQQISCFTNDDGRRVCSDRFQPDEARFDREIRNDQGIVIRTEQGEITPEEQAEIDAAIAAEEQRTREAEERGRYERFVLDSFTSVDGIVSARDRQLKELEGQVTIVQLILNNAARRLEELEVRAQRFSPYSEDENAPPMPENLSLEIEQKKISIQRYQQRLDQSLRNQDETREEYQRHIDTFRQLKGLDA
jgi:hypothetical protein